MFQNTIRYIIFNFRMILGPNLFAYRMAFLRVAGSVTRQSVHKSFL